MRYRIKLFAVVILVIAHTINASAEQILIWKDCVKEALKNHPDLASAREKLNQAKANKWIATANLLPQVSTDATAKRSKAAGKKKADTYSYSITGKQLLFDGFKTPYDIGAAEKNINSAEYDYEVTSSNIRLRLAIAFTELLQAQEFLYIAEDIATRRKKNLELVWLRYEAGREHKGSLLTVEADLAQAEFEVTQARRNTDLAQRRLNQEMGRSELRPVNVKGDFKTAYLNRKKPDFEGLAENNPFLKELIAKKEAARLGVKSAKADFFPQVYANASAGRTDSDWPPKKHEWSFGGSVSLPLFEGGSRIAEASRAKAAFNQAHADEESGRDGVIFTLEEAWTQLQDAMDKITVQQKFLTAAEERARIAQAQYSNGLILFDNWVIIEDNLVMSKKSFLNTQADALIAEAVWIQAKGGTLDDEE